MNEILNQIYNSIRLDNETIAIHTLSGIIKLKKEDITFERESQTIVRLTFNDLFFPTTDVPIILQNGNEKYILKYHFSIDKKGHYYECLK